MTRAGTQAKVREANANAALRWSTDLASRGGRKAEFQRQTTQRRQPPSRSPGQREVRPRRKGRSGHRQNTEHANDPLWSSVCCCSPEGSHTDDTSQEHHTPHRHAKPPQPGNPNSDPHEFDDEFDDDDPLPVIGHCKALYGFDGGSKLMFLM